jgi:hypothetical protein
LKIPKKFKLFGHTINVIEKEKLNSHDAKWGSVNFIRKEILIDKNLDDDFKEQTFLHELIHLIFDFLTEDELAKNEKFVNNISELLYQAFETMEYK